MKISTINESALNFQAFTTAYYSLVEQEKTHSEGCGWEIINENELADEMTYALVNPVSTSSVSEVAPGDFEALYQWFLS